MERFDLIARYALQLESWQWKLLEKKSLIWLLALGKYVQWVVYVTIYMYMAMILFVLEDVHWTRLNTSDYKQFVPSVNNPYASYTDALATVCGEL